MLGLGGGMELVAGVLGQQHHPDLVAGLAERVRQWDKRHDGLYSAALSVTPGSKVGGHPSWIQGPQWPRCRCGRRVQHLLTIASGEFDERGRWLPLEDRADPTSTAPQPYAGPDPWPPGIMPGDVGSLYLFTCTVCAERPLAGMTQSWSPMAQCDVGQ